MGVFSSVLKSPKVIPVHEEDSKVDCNNYRLIALLKILENLVYNRITKFLNDNRVYLLQFVFQHNYSTKHTLIKLTEDIRKNLDGRKVGCCIFVDLQKATVDHNILLVKLEHCSKEAVLYSNFVKNRSNF